MCSVGDNAAPSQLHYIVFAGRSNSGKSSAINALCGGRYARVAKTPGRTRLINLFRLGGGNPAATLADLPGYGYAVASKSERRGWEARITRFLRRADIRCLVLVADCRRGIGELDRQLLSLCAPTRTPVLLLLNKADKLSRQAQRAAAGEAGSAVAAPVVLFSALKKTGVAEAREFISGCLPPD